MIRDDIEAMLVRATACDFWELLEAAQVELRDRGWTDVADRVARARDAIEDRLGVTFGSRRR